MGTDFLPNSGQWLVQKKEFVEWRKSSVSSVLWLRGIRKYRCPDLQGDPAHKELSAGSGKTKLV